MDRKIPKNCHPSVVRRSGRPGDLLFLHAATNHRGSPLTPVIPAGAAVSAVQWRDLLSLATDYWLLATAGSRRRLATFLICHHERSEGSAFSDNWRLGSLGHELELTVDEGGIALSPFAPKFSDQAEAFRRTEARHRNSYRELGK